MTWIETLIVFVVGYWFGSRSRPLEEAASSVQGLARKVKRKVTKQRLGGIERLSAEELLIRKTPYLREEEEEMERVIEEDVLSRP